MTESYAHFKELDGFLASGDWKAALKVADNILKADPRDKEAGLCKVLTLIHLAHWKEGQEAARSLALPLHEAYCHYQLGKFDESFALASKLSDPAAKHLLAQIEYRRERYAEASAIFKELIQLDPENNDLKSNYLAALVLAGLNDTAQQIIKQEVKGAAASFEFNYNTAAYYISITDYETAERFLKESLRIGEAALLAEDQTSEEIAEELAVINVQLGYVMQLKGDSAAAGRLYEAQLKLKSDPTVTAVATNNIVSLRGEHTDLFDSLHKIERMSEDPILTFSSRQKKVVGFNHCLLLHHMNSKNKECTEAISQLRAKYPDLSADLSLIEASILLRQKKTDESIKLIEAASKDATGGLAAPLALAQVELMQSNFSQVVKILKSLDSKDLIKAGVVASICGAYEKLDDLAGVTSTLNDFVNAYDKADKATQQQASKGFGFALRYLGEIYLRIQDYKGAAATFKRILEVCFHFPNPKIEPNNLFAVANCITALSFVDPSAVSAFENLLPMLEKESFNVNELENLPITPLIAEKSPVQSTGTVAVVNKPKKKKKKKPLLPKNYDPAVPPNPERWLKKTDRSTYKPKPKKGRKRGQDEEMRRGVQGVVEPVAKEPSAPAPVIPAPSAPKAAPKAQPKAKGKPKKKGKR